jgi:hypothetical protein
LLTGICIWVSAGDESLAPLQGVPDGPGQGLSSAVGDWLYEQQSNPEEQPAGCLGFAGSHQISGDQVDV